MADVVLDKSQEEILKNLFLKIKKLTDHDVKTFIPDLEGKTKFFGITLNVSQYDLDSNTRKLIHKIFNDFEYRAKKSNKMIIWLYLR